MKTEACGQSGLIYEPIAGKLLRDQAYTELQATFGEKIESKKHGHKKHKTKSTCPAHLRSFTVVLSLPCKHLKSQKYR
jgi:hypothetical protein